MVVEGVELDRQAAALPGTARALAPVMGHREGELQLERGGDRLVGSHLACEIAATQTLAADEVLLVRGQDVAGVLPGDRGEGIEREAAGDPDALQPRHLAVELEEARVGADTVEQRVALVGGAEYVDAF